ncbi:hypothetical protein TcasGA2_TC014565 [Tribolium castaneum]|uniref:Uncharacterized protein n=1 Tax=Tribolium castaneum TaxID=7070 RepID=D6WMI5_TRICA|nr:hypothetical protein TcasGA2_TC014565 [Tribolium castaneum]
MKQRDLNPDRRFTSRSGETRRKNRLVLAMFGRRHAHAGFLSDRFLNLRVPWWSWWVLITISVTHDIVNYFTTRSDILNNNCGKLAFNDVKNNRRIKKLVTLSVMSSQRIYPSRARTVERLIKRKRLSDDGKKTLLINVTISLVTFTLIRDFIDHPVQTRFIVEDDCRDHVTTLATN